VGERRGRSSWLVFAGGSSKGVKKNHMEADGLRQRMKAHGERQAGAKARAPDIIAVIWLLALC
jgi:hypothetical protein